MKKTTIACPVNTKVFLVLTLCAVFQSLAVLADSITVLKGTSVSIPVPDGIRKIITANPSIVDARPSDDGKGVLVSGLEVGTSEVRIQQLQGVDLVDNVVVSDNLNQTLVEVKDLLSDVEGLDMKVLGNKIVFKGNILTKSDFDKVTKIVNAYPGSILNMTTFDRSGMNKYVEEAILKDIGVNTVTARVIDDTVILEGTVYSAADKARAEEMAKLRMPNVKSLLTVQDVMIETDVQFVQLSGDHGKNMGMNVLDTLQATAGGNGSSINGGFNNLPISFGVSGSARLQADLTKGDNKIVASPHLSTKSGETGSFQSGGTSYIKVSGTTSGDLKSVDYGVILKVKPTLQDHDKILNEVSIEVSIPTVDDLGNFEVQKYTSANTSLCKIGESMVMSGMTQTIAVRSGSKTPLLGDVPLVNLFFSNKTTKNHRDEFVIVVTPQPIFPSASTGSPFGESHKALLQDKDKALKE